VLPRRPEKFDFARGRARSSADPHARRIVLIYNGADDKLVYRTGVAVFDRKDPANSSRDPMSPSSPRK